MGRRAAGSRRQKKCIARGPHRTLVAWCAPGTSLSFDDLPRSSCSRANEAMYLCRGGGREPDRPRSACAPVKVLTRGRLATRPPQGWHPARPAYRSQCHAQKRASWRAAPIAPAAYAPPGLAALCHRRCDSTQHRRPPRARQTRGLDRAACKTISPRGWYGAPLHVAGRRVPRAWRWYPSRTTPS